MKKRLAWLLVAAMLMQFTCALSVIAVSDEMGNGPYIMRLESVGTPSEPEVEIRLGLRGTQGDTRTTLGFQFTLTYDAEKLSLTDLSAAADIGGLPRQNDNKLVWISFEGLPVGTEPVTVARAAFTVIGPQQSTERVAFVPSECSVTAFGEAENMLGTVKDCDLSIDTVTLPEQEALCFTSPAEMPYLGTMTLSVGGGSGDGAVTYELTSGADIAELAGDVLTAKELGTVTVTATKAGSASYSAARVSYDVTIGKATPTGAPSYTRVEAGGRLADAAIDVGSITPGGSIAWDDGDETVIDNADKVYGWTFTPDDETHYTTLTGSINFSRQAQEPLTILCGDTVPYGGTLALAVAGGSGGGSVFYMAEDGTGSASISGSRLTAERVGTVTVTAVKASDDIYDEASASKEITVEQATPIGTPCYTAVEVGSTLADANLTVGSITPSGSIAWDDGDETVIETDTAYGWTFTPEDGESYAVLHGSIDFSLQAQEPLSIVCDDAVTYGETLTLDVAGGSGDGAVTYAVEDGTGSGELDGNILTATRAGVLTVIAVKAGSDGYAPITATKTVTVTKATPTGAPCYTAVAVGRPLSETNLTAGSISVAGSVAWDAGSNALVRNTRYGWTFTPEDETNYESLNGDFNPTLRIPEALVFTCADTMTYGDKPLLLTVSGGGGSGTVTYELVSGADVAKLNANKLTLMKSGTVTVTAVQASDGVYDMSRARLEITVHKKTPSGTPKYEPITEAGKTLADAALEKGSISLKGTIAWDLPEETKVVPNTAYRWTFTPTDGERYATRSESVVLYRVAGGGGGGAIIETPTQTIVQNDAKTVSLSVPAEEKDGGYTAAITESKELTDALRSGVKQLVIQTDAPETATSVETAIPAAVVQSIAKDGKMSLTVSTPAGGAALTDKGVAALAGYGGEVRVGMTVSDARRATITVSAGGNAVNKLAGGVLATLPKLAAESDAVLVKCNDDGSEEIIPYSLVTANGTKAKLEGSAAVTVRERSRTFPDMAGHWAERDVSFTAAREILNGSTDGNFYPEQTMTRGMIAMTLYNLEREQGNLYGNGGFTDVEDFRWYKDAVGWAKQAGIMDGYAIPVPIEGSDDFYYVYGTFAPSDAVTREQIAKILYTYAQYLGMTTVADPSALAAFSDRNALDVWADEAMGWAVSQGLFRGTESGELDPLGELTRAEMAVLMSRFVKMVLK